MATFMWHNTDYDNELWHVGSKQTMGLVTRTRDMYGNVLWEATPRWAKVRRVFLKRTTAKMFLRAEAKRHVQKHWDDELGWAPGSGMATGKEA